MGYVEIRQLLNRLAFADEERDGRSLADCLADGVELGGVRGRDAVVAVHLAQWAKDGQERRWRYQLSNTFLVEPTDLDAGAATAVSLVLLHCVRGRSGVDMPTLGRVRDDLVREAGGWRLARRAVELDARRARDAPAEELPATFPSAPWAFTVTPTLPAARRTPPTAAGVTPSATRDEVEMADYTQIVQLLYRYAYAHNERDPVLLASCFADGVRLQGTVGRDNVVAAYQTLWAGQRSFDRRHVFANTFIVEESPTEAITMTNQMVYWIKDRDAVHLGGLGRYRDHVVLERGEWRILARDVSLDIPYDPGDMPGAPAFDLPVPGLTLSR